MSLHARQIAMAAGAEGDEIAVVAQQMIDSGHIKPAAAEQLLTTLRGVLTEA
jgi:hydroxymethylglutaryl-CoA reductase